MAGQAARVSAEAERQAAEQQALMASRSELPDADGDTILDGASLAECGSRRDSNATSFMCDNEASKPSLFAEARPSMFARPLFGAKPLFGSIPLFGKVRPIHTAGQDAGVEKTVMQHAARRGRGNQGQQNELVAAGDRSMRQQGEIVSWTQCHIQS